MAADRVDPEVLVRVNQEMWEDPVSRATKEHLMAPVDPADPAAGILIRPRWNST
jgi:hypothetical protein